MILGGAPGSKFPDIHQNGGRRIHEDHPLGAALDVFG